jgi:hypothetical protein
MTWTLSLAVSNSPWSVYSMRWTPLRSVGLSKKKKVSYYQNVGASIDALAHTLFENCNYTDVYVEAAEVFASTEVPRDDGTSGLRHGRLYLDFTHIYGPFTRIHGLDIISFLTTAPHFGQLKFFDHWHPGH